MKPKVAVGLSYFNSVKELPRLLDPIYKHVDLVIGIDGRYPLFDWPTNLSTDGSTELLIEKYNAVVEVNKSPVEQIDKRNQYLEIAENAGMDFVLVFDTDEFLYQYKDWQKFYKQLEELPEDQLIANMLVWISPDWAKNHNAVNDNTWHPYTKVLRPSVRYDTTHWCYVKKGNTKHEFLLAETTLDGIRLSADSKLRSKKYIKAGYKWAGAQLVEENRRMNVLEIQRFKMFEAYFKKMQEKILAVPGTKVTMDNT